MKLVSRISSISTLLGRQTRQHAGPIIAALLIGYFLYHSVQGERGLRSYIRLGAEVEKQRSLLQALSAERQDLEAKVGRLRMETLDLDMLDEEARRQLGFLSPDDIVIHSGPLEQDTP